MVHLKLKTTADFWTTKMAFSLDDCGVDGDELVLASSGGFRPSKTGNVVEVVKKVITQYLCITSEQLNSTGLKKNFIIQCGQVQKVLLNRATTSLTLSYCRGTEKHNVIFTLAADRVAELETFFERLKHNFQITKRPTAFLKSNSVSENEEAIELSSSLPDSPASPSADFPRRKTLGLKLNRPSPNLEARVSAMSPKPKTSVSCTVAGKRAREPSPARDVNCGRVRIRAMPPGVRQDRFDFGDRSPSETRRSEALSGGLSNFGNACYANSLLQVLLQLPNFVEELQKAMEKQAVAISGKHFVDCCNEIVRVGEYVNFCKRSRNQKVANETFGEVLNVQKVNSCLAKCDSALPGCAKFGLKLQQDAHEYLKYLIDILEYSAGVSVVEKIFLSQLQDIVECSVCHTRGVSKTKAVDFSLDLPDPGACLEGCVKLSDLIQNFFSPSSVPEFRCEKCGDKGAILKCEPGILGQCLVLHLKRFDACGTKRMDKVVFKQHLRIGEAKYRLHGAIFHHGSSLNFGHYSSMVAENDKAVFFNDSKVRIENLSDLSGWTCNQRDVYMIFYIRIC